MSCCARVQISFPAMFIIVNGSIDDIQSWWFKGDKVGDLLEGQKISGYDFLNLPWR